ncbi:MAG: polyamine aminopropyltransferase [Candidatus Omnitrophica bacterium]|nr:polyamine aminopropyltransferase [Candidatus Omnitrophota bacterium]MCM8802226.1 polyamine aminopropyltransferase [Candidatus Omnitrophota bacterium]
MQKNFNNIVIDWYNPYGIGIALKIKKKLIEKKTKFQKIEVYETLNFGKVLFIDDLIQSIEKGEESYHELLVHPVLFSHPNPENILIVGGGEGATLREVLKHPVKKVQMVDIDQEMIEIAKRYLKFDRGAFKNKKAEIIIGDGFEFLKQSNQIYDVIIADATDPSESASCSLYTEKFYKLCYEHLNKNGIYVTQGGTCIFLHHNRIKKLYNDLKKIFKNVKVYSSSVFGLLSNWVFIVGIKGDIKIDEKPNKKIDKKLKFYTPELQRSIFTLPLFLQKILLSPEEKGPYK